MLSGEGAMQNVPFGVWLHMFAMCHAQLARGARS